MGAAFIKLIGNSAPGRTGATIKLLLVGKHLMILEALRSYLDASRRYQVVGMIADSDSLRRTKSLPDADVVLLDLSPPAADGPSSTRKLLALLPKCRVVGLSAADDRGSILALIRAGARGCLFKAGSPRELFKAVDVVYSGETYFSPGISRMIHSEFLNEISSSDDRAHPSLKNSERQLLKLIADGLSNKEMAVHLNMSVRTVEKYRESLMAKLGIRSVAGLTKFAIRTGLSTLES